MTRFMEVIYPQHSGAGKLADLTTNTGSPDNRIAEGLIVLRDWINESIWTLNLSNSPRVLEVFLIASVSQRCRQMFGLISASCRRSTITESRDTSNGPDSFQKCPMTAFLSIR